MKMLHARVLKVFVFVGILKVTIALGATNQIMHPGDLVTYSPVNANTTKHPSLIDTDGWVVRVVNSSHHDPPVLVSWISHNYTLFWKHHQDLVLKTRSECADVDVGTIVCKNSFSTAEEYVNHLDDFVKIGMLFRSTVSNTMFWKGDVCIYLGKTSADLFKRLWCFRSKKMFFVESFENLQILGVTNYPGVYEYKSGNHLVGFYRYPVVSRYSCSVLHKTILKGHKNNATLTIDCNNKDNVRPFVYHSVMHSSNVAYLTNETISVPFERNLVTTWTATYPGPNYILFMVKEGSSTIVKTGQWYEVIEKAKHEIKIQAPGDDERFVEANKTITVTQTSSVESVAFIAFVFFNGSDTNQSQSDITDKSVHVTTIEYKKRGVHELFSITWNKLSLELTELSIIIAGVFEIQNLTVTHEKVIKTNAEVIFHLKALRGYGATCAIHYGDGTQDSFETTWTGLYHTFTNDTDIDTAIKTDLGLNYNFTKFYDYIEPGLYRVNVTCENEINSASYITSVLAQKEITNFNVYNISPYEFGQPIKVEWDMTFGTNVTVDIWYNDIHCNTSTSPEESESFTYCLVDDLAHFDPDSQVDLKITAWNRVSNVTIIRTVDVLEQLVLTSLVALTTTSQFGSGVPGAGPDRNMFPAEYPVMLKANYTGASATSHGWRFTYPEWIDNCTNCGSRTTNSVELSKTFQGSDKRCTVMLSVENSVGEDVHYVDVDIENSIRLSTVTIGSPIVVNTTETLSINLQHIGSHSCLAVDFNDNSTLLLYGDQHFCELQYKNTEFDVSFTAKDESTRSIEIEHVFTALGRFQVKIKGKNYVSSDSIEQDVVVVLGECHYPNVTITGFNESLPGNGSLPEHYKSQILTLTTDNEIKCELTELTQTKWSVFKLDGDPRHNLNAIDSMPRNEYQLPFSTDLTNPELILNSRSFKYGFYAVTARLEMDGHPNVFNEDTKYFHVVATPWLEPAITTGFIYTVIFREKAVLNASATVDPDFEDLDGITFEWFCRDKADIEPFGPDYDKEPLLYVPVLNDTFAPADLNSTGCFGEGRGRLNATGVVLEMESMYMVEGKTYVITLVSSKFHPEFGLRMSSTEIYFDVIFGLPPSLQTNCLKNCQKKVNPDEKLIIEATCKSRCYGQLEFKWTLFWFDHVYDPEPYNLTKLNEVSTDILRNMVTNPIDELQLAFKPNTMVPGRKYIAQLKATRPNGVFGELRYTLLLNDAPTGGVCGINPSRGVAMSTTFNITCKNWTDPDPPITYDYVYEKFGVRTVFFSASGNPGETIISSGEMPIGDPNKDNELKIFVNVKDKYEGTREIYFTIKVEPPNEADVNLTHMKDLISSEENPLDSFIKSGDPQKALQMAGVLASVLNHIDSNTNTSGNRTAEENEKIMDESRQIDELKQTIMKSLVAINVSDMATLLQMSGTTQALTENADKLSPGTQDVGVQLCNSSVSGLTTLSQQQSSFKNVQSAVKNLAGTLGQLISAAAAPPDQENQTISNASVGRAESSISMLNNLHDATLRYMVTNEGPSTSSTKHITLQSEKVSIRNMGKKGNVASDCAFKTPSPEVFGFGDIVKDVNASISQLDSVTIKMEVFNKNPYTWDNTSKTVTSKIASLNLSSNKKIQLSNLTEEIGITISRDPSQFPAMSSFYMKPDEPDKDFDGDTYLKYHCFNRTSRWTAMSFEIYPEDTSFNLNVYLKTGGKPDIKTGDFNLKYKLPDFSTCDLEKEENTTQHNETIVIDPFKHCTLHPYSVFVSNVDFNETGEHCFAVQVKNGTIKADDLDSSGNSRRKRSFACDIGKRRMRRSCVIIPPPPPKPPTESPFKVLVADNLGFDGEYFFPNQTPNYNMTMYESSCLYWDEDNQTWSGHGCRVGPLTSRSNIQCFCNHLTSFGSDLVVAPNPIDFSSVFSNFGSLQDNVAVLALISTVLGLYILGAIWGRRADKRDKLMVGPTILHNPQGTYHYLVTLYTGNRQGSGTTAKVFFKMAGDNDETIPIKLWDSKRPCFERGQENSFIVSYPREVGELTYVQIWHNNAGLSASWYLSRLTIKDIQTNQQWYFVCDNWLAVESEDGKVCRVIPVANDQELTNFNQLFTARTVKGLADGHLWFSIFSRPPSSNFTRVQRLSCCLCLLCCTMITSAMFYNMGGDGPSPFAIHIGSLVIDLKQFVIALQSSLIIIPINVAIVQIFRNLRPKQSKEEIYSKETDDNSENKETNDGKPKGQLPHWFIYVAYSLCYLASAASIFFTLLYSIQWGKEKSTEWVIAMVTAFLQSVLLLQPVKVLILAVILAVFVRKPSDDDKDEAPVTYDLASSVQSQKLRKKCSKKTKIYSPPDPETLQKARIKRLKEIQMNSIMKEIAAFFIFLIMLTNVAYYHRDPNTFLLTKTLYENFDEVNAYGIDLGAASDADSLWMWARETLVPGLYAKEWYNGKKATKGYIANMEDYLVGVPRIRQVRVKEDSCTVDKLFKASIPHCYDAFSLTNEEDETFDVSWESLNSGSSRKRRELHIPETEEEWIERMSMTVSKDETQSDELLPRNVLFRESLQQNGGSVNENMQSNKRYNDAKRQKRAIDPIASSVTGKNRRKKKRLLGSAKPKTYSIKDDALLPDGRIISCLERWRHQSTMELRGFPYWGAISLYSGGGYAANFGYDPVSAYTVISDLHSNGWIDIQSRATFVEFTVYNANTNLFGIISILVEFPSSSAAVTKVEYQAARFYLHLNSAQTLSHILVIFFMLYFLYREGRLVYKQRWAYFKGFWNWVETILVVSEFMTIILFLARLYEVDRNLLQLRENPNDYVPFQYAAGADAALCYILGILVFFYTLRFLRLLRFNKNFLVLGITLSRISGPIVSFCLPFFFGFLAFGLFAFSVFGTELLDYSTFTRTMVTQFSMMLGDFDFEALVMTNPLLGPLYFFAFVALNIFILMNVFLAIINDSYADVQVQEQATKNEYEILEYITEKIQTRIKGEPKKTKKARKVRPKKQIQNSTTKPHYVTLEETKKKLQKSSSNEVYELQENEEPLSFDNPMIHQNDTFYENTCQITRFSENKNHENEPSVMSNSSGYLIPLSSDLSPGVNTSKLDNCGTQLEGLLNKLQHGERNEIQIAEAIKHVSEEKQQDICFRVMVFMETAQ